MNNNISEIEKQVRGTMKVDNLKPSIVGSIITRNFLEGKITKEQARDAILKNWGVKDEHRK